MANKTGAIPDALKHFDELPDSAGVDVDVVAGLIGCEPVTVWRMAADGRLPAPRKISARMTRWTVGELRKALARLTAPPMRQMQRRNMAKAA